MNMHHVARAALAAVMLAAPVGAGAQVPIIQSGPGEALQFPPRGRPEKTGTGRITGRVIAVENGTPIRRAQVRISGQDITPKTSLTDGDGRFEFRDLPSGRFTLQATKSGYVSVQYGQTRPFESGRPIELAEKQVLDNADISMPRGSVISGRIVDEFGDPVPDAAVTAMRQTWSGGRRRLTPAPGRVAQTNDLGQFRIYGLPPGDYYVSATLRSGTEFMAMEMAMTAVRVGGWDAGGSGSMPSSGYAPTYYPGTQNAAEAQKITLNVGQEVGNADFALFPVRLAKITGIVLGSDGKPLPNAIVTVAPSTRSDAMLLNAPNTARTTREGAFTLNNVPPGEYQLQANSVQVFTTSEGNNTMVFSMRMAGDGAGGDSEFGSVPLVVAGEDISNIVMTTTKGVTATGRVVFEGGAKPESLSSLRLSAPSADSGSGISFGGVGAGSVKADGSFELKGLSGLRLIRAAGLPPGWTLKSVRVNGTDVTDTGADFRPGEAVSGIEVVLTSRTTAIAGSVTSADGAPLKDYTVVIFSEDPEMWRMPMTRWVTGTRPDQDGRFKVQNMPAGSYYAIAVEYLPTGEWGDPELLDRLRAKAKHFTLGEGSSETLDLKLSDGS